MRPNFSPQRRWVPNALNPSDSCIASLAGFGWAIRASSTAMPSSRARSISAASSAVPIPWPRWPASTYSDTSAVRR